MEFLKSHAWQLQVFIKKSSPSSVMEVEAAATSSELDAILFKCQLLSLNDGLHCHPAQTGHSFTNRLLPHVLSEETLKIHTSAYFNIDFNIKIHSTFIVQWWMDSSPWMQPITWWVYIYIMNNTLHNVCCIIVSAQELVILSVMIVMDLCHNHYHPLIKTQGMKYIFIQNFILK